MALSDAAGDTVQTYEYSVYGEVAVEDANHPNPYMFAGVRYDIEIGLYYNRARYYHPFTGRFLQTDPTGYSDGMNWYAYCKNNPLNFLDPFGLAIWGMSFSKDEDRVLVFDWVELDPNDEDFERNMANYDFLLETDDPLDRRRLESAVRQLWGLETGENLLSKTRGLGIIIETQRGIYVGEGQDRHRVCGKAPWDTNKIVWDPTYVTADQPAFITVGHELIHKYNDMVLEPAGKGVMAPTTDELLEVEEARTYGYTLWYGSGDARRTYNFSRGENMGY